MIGPLPRFIPCTLAGRCATGEERGAGTVVHAVDASQARRLGGDIVAGLLEISGSALCSARPGKRRSIGWSPRLDLAVTCGRCLARIEERANPKPALVRSRSARGRFSVMRETVAPVHETLEQGAEPVSTVAETVAAKDETLLEVAMRVRTALPVLCRMLVKARCEAGADRAREMMRDLGAAIAREQARDLAAFVSTLPDPVELQPYQRELLEQLERLPAEGGRVVVKWPGSAR